MSVQLKGFDEVQRSLRQLPAALRSQAMAPAINKVAAKANTEIARAVTAEFDIKSSEVRSSVKVNRARAKAEVIEAVIDIFGSAKKKGRSLNLIHFLAAVQGGGSAFRVRGKQANKKQLAALAGQLGFSIKRGGGLKRIPGAFVGNKGRTVFERIPGVQMGSRAGRLTKHSQAIRPVQVIGVSQMFSSRRVSSRVLDRINKELPVEIDRAVKLVLDRAAR
jgi:hypothetical protein